MATKLINVRLDADRQRKANALQKNGMAISELVREAIDAKFEALSKSGRPADAKAWFDELDRNYPVEHLKSPRKYSVHNRLEAASAIRQAMKRRSTRQS